MARRERGPAVPGAGPRARTAQLPPRDSPMAGFTLVELMVVVAIGALLLAAAVPAWGDWLATTELANHAHRLANSMALARVEAVKRGQRVNLCRAPDGRHCRGAGGWEAGWLVHVDADGDAVNGDGEPVLRAEGPAPAGIYVRANRPVDSYVSFNALGQARLVNGGLQMGTLVVCRRGLPAHRIVLANSGRVRLEKTRDLCTD
jgi:type IV fimbrial biogenesis protein FimT